MDTLVAYGSEIKSAEETATGWKVGGYLVVFGTHDVSSLKDKFLKGVTDFDIQDGERTSIYYHHGLDGTLKRTKLGDGKLYVKDVGVWFEGEIQKRKDYLAQHVERIGKGLSQTVSVKGVEHRLFGLSSGVPSHLVDREPVDGGHVITRWPLGKDCSITPTPAEPLTTCGSIKSLEEVEDELKYNARQPRDDMGKWTDSATGKISVGHALHVAVSEGLAQHHIETLKEGLSSGRLDTREKVLAHIDAGHRQSSVAAQYPHIASMDLAQFRASPRWGTPKADATYQEVRDITSKHPELKETKSGVALREATVKREGLESKFQAAGGIVHGINDSRYRGTNETNKEKRDLIEKIKVARAEEGRLNKAHSDELSEAIHAHVHGAPMPVEPIEVHPDTDKAARRNAHANVTAMRVQAAGIRGQLGTLRQKMTATGGRKSLEELDGELEPIEAAFQRLEDDLKGLDEDPTNADELAPGEELASGAFDPYEIGRYVTSQLALSGVA